MLTYAATMIGYAMFIFVLIEFVLWLLQLYANKTSDFSITNGTLMDASFSQPDSYTNVKWYEDYKIEAKKIFSSFKWSPYVYWVAPKMEGKYITVGKYHHRRTAYSKNNIIHNGSKSIWFFGGSTIWGWGARDEYTIPSCFLRTCTDIGLDINVQNYGQLGYVSSQEMISLITSLRRGDIPDHVIFYDGLNDVFSAYQQHLAGLPQNEINRKISFESNKTALESLWALVKSSRVANFLKKERRDRATIMSETDSNKLAGEVVARYLSNIEVVTALANYYGFTLTCFWQPVLFFKNKKTEFEEKVYEISSFWESFYLSVNKIISNTNKMPENFFNMTDIFCNENGPVYIDPWHTNEYANNIIAKYMLEKTGLSKTL